MKITGAGTVCSVEGCQKAVQSLGLCRPHYTMQRNYGRTDYVRVRHRGEACKVEGCGRPVKSVSLCATHYGYQRKYGRLEKLQRRRTVHPLYATWLDHKHFGRMCPEWQDLWVFAAAVGERPGVNYTLERPDKALPYGPGNAEWRENLERRPGESDATWRKRKWEHRHRDKSIERGRNLQRHYGISLTEFEDMLAAQQHGCAICQRAETATDRRTGKPRRLAVDHCHTTGKVRGLLCWDCNTALGKLRESISSLDAMRAYLIKHGVQEPPD